MKLSARLGLILATAFGIGCLPARTWTSTDGSKTFEATFKSYNEALKQVTVTLPNGRSSTFSINKLSEEDRVFLAEEASKLAKAGANREAAEQFAQSDIGKAMKKMQILDGSRFATHTFEAVPEFFILYYSASW